MKKSIQEALAAARAQGRAAFIPFVTGCFPGREACLDLMEGLEKAGADLIEIGVPFSDPIADGPVIQSSSTLALAAGVTPAAVLELAGEASRRVSAPLVLMTYYNPMLAMGLEEFATRAASAGVAGVIVPDLTPEEAGPWRQAALAAGLDTIFLAAPTTGQGRLADIAAVSQGFLYYVSMTGVTGGQLRLGQELARGLAAAKALSPVPVCVGFGVSTPEQAAALAGQADGVIVGSALMKVLLEAEEATRGVEEALELARALRNSFPG